jgi:hypothetical protein
MGRKRTTFGNAWYAEGLGSKHREIAERDDRGVMPRPLH